MIFSGLGVGRCLGFSFNCVANLMNCQLFRRFQKRKFDFYRSCFKIGVMVGLVVVEGTFT